MKNNKQETTKPTIDEEQPTFVPLKDLKPVPEKNNVNFDIALQHVKNQIDIQRQPGNFNYNEYMYGMLIGLECAYFTMQGLTDKNYTPKPVQFLVDAPKVVNTNLFPYEE